MANAIIAKFGGDNKDFKNTLRDNDRQLGRFEKSVGKGNSAIRGMGKAILAAFTVSAIKGFVDELDDIGKSAGKIGVTTDEIQKLRFAAEQTGGSASELDNALEKFNNRLGEARQGTGEGVKAFEQLGISLYDSEGLARRNIDVFRDFADGLDAIKDPAEKAALVNDLVGRSAGFIVNTVRGGSAALNEYGDQLERNFGVKTEEAIRQAEKFNDSLNLLKNTVGGLATQGFNAGVDFLANAANVQADLLDKIGIDSYWMTSEEQRIVQENFKRMAEWEKEQSNRKQSARDKESRQNAEVANDIKEHQKLREEAAKQREKEIEKVTKAEAALADFIATVAFDQLSLAERKLFIEGELNRVRKSADRSSQTKVNELRVEEIELVKQLIANEVELREQQAGNNKKQLENQKEIEEASSDLNDNLNGEKELRRELIEQAKEELDVANDKLRAEAKALKELQKQALARAAALGDSSSQSRGGSRLNKLNQKADDLESQGRFSAAARARGKAQELQEKLTAKRREELAKDIQRARKRGDDDEVNRLQDIGRKEGLVGEEGGDARLELLRDRDSKQTAFEDEIKSINQSSLDKMEELNDKFRELISKFE